MFRTLFLVFTVFSQVSAVSIRERFTEWARKYDIQFYHDHHLEESVLSNWIDNDIYIDYVNSQNRTYTLGHNRYSGMNHVEFSDLMGLRRELARPNKRLNYHSDHMNTVVDMSTIPVSIDWVEKGAVTPVKNQGQCGSCWSFSTTGALEGAFYVKNGNLVSFSEQELVDCDNFKHGGKDMSCNGGLMDNAFSWIQQNGGLCTEEDYPYTSGTTKSAGSCAMKSCDTVANSQVESVYDVPASSDADMMLALSKQPVSIAIQADQQDFQLYKSGVFTGSCGTSLDHGVLAVGYGSLDGQDYYLVKNSWGESWGQDGYIMLGRGDEFNRGGGQCGMLLQPSYPTL